MNTYIVKMMSCDDNENEDKCVENKHVNKCIQQMQQPIYNKYEDKHDIYI